tara:strand:+ start:11801 stop:14971 length:3171 start_codon:yes stop_codon:yes gene_type:complete
MATTEQFLTSGSATTSYTYSIDKIKDTDIKVRVNGVDLTYTTSSPSAGQYKIAGSGITLGTAVDAIHVYRDTELENGDSATYVAGSSIRAADLNANHKLVRFASQEQNQKIQTDRLNDLSVTSAKIKDDTIVNADINSGAAIAFSKLATGALPSGITVASANIVNGSIVNEDVSNSANISGTKLADDSVGLTKLGSGTLPSDIVVTSTNIENATIVDADISGSAAISHSKLSLNIVNSDINATANIAGSKLANDSVALTKLGGGALPTDITVSSNNIVDGTIVDGDISTGAGIAQSKIATGTLPSGIKVDDDNIVTGTLDNRYYTETELLTGGAIDGRYYTETELNAGQLDNRYYTESELTGGSLDGRYYTEAELNGGQLNSLYFTESEITGGAADGRYYTETELDAGQLDNRYYTETELNAGQLDSRYYTETEAEALFLRQDSSETIASGVAWSNADDKVATTAAINARIIDLVDEVGGFTVIATELVFPNTNPQGATGQAAILSIGSLTQGYTRSGTTVTVANGTVGNSTVTITGVPQDLPSGFGLLVESTSTLNTYTFHRLVPKATEVTTVATNITNIVAAGANVADISNFADLYQISNSAPTQRVDGNSLVSGDLWFDNSNGNLRVWNGSSWAIITPAQSVLDDVAIVSGAVTYSEDLGIISDAVSTGSSNGSLEIVADALEDEITFTVTASGGAYFIDGVSKPALTLYKGWTYTFDLSSNTLGSHPLRFKSGGSAYNTGVTVTGTQGQAGAKVQLVVPESQPTSFNYYCTNHSGMGNTITVKDDPIKTVSDNVVKIIATADNSTNINTVAGNNSNVTAVAGNSTNINAAVSNASNINAVVSNATNINAVAGNNTNITAVANNSSNINSAVANASNINSAVSNASNINSAVSNATNINTVATNITDVNSFADRYQIATSNPSTDGGGNALTAGDLFFNSSANELRIWNGSQWQGGVTATGDLSQVSGSTFTGDNKYNDNIKAKFGSDSDLLIFHDTNDSIINESGTGNLKIQNAGTTKVEVTATGAAITGLMSATTIDGSAGNNLTLDFGTL